MKIELSTEVIRDVVFGDNHYQKGDEVNFLNFASLVIKTFTVGRGIDWQSTDYLKGLNLSQSSISYIKYLLYHSELHLNKTLADKFLSAYNGNRGRETRRDNGGNLVVQHRLAPTPEEQVRQILDQFDADFKRAYK